LAEGRRKQVSFDIDRLVRLQSMSIDDSTRKILQEIKPVVAQHIDSAVEAGYRKLLSFPEAAKAYAGMNMEDAKRAQREHWLNDMLPAAFTDEQLLNGVAIFQRRERQGLNLRWFYVFYNAYLATLIEKITPSYRKKPEYFSQVVIALNKIFLFELELASSAYMSSAQEAASEKINKHADEFETNVSHVVEKVATSANQLQTSAKTMASIADQTAEKATAASAATEKTGSNTQTVAAATEQLSSSIGEISRQVSQSSRIAGAAVDEAQRTNVLVQGLAEAAGKIGDVVKLINNIASQTNLLALNATIEAARAGDAGKGFAVVAGEVKNLANQTARATDEISMQIGAVQSATKNAVVAIDGIGSTIGKINEITATIAAAVEEQGAATREIARNVHEAASAGDNLGEIIASLGTTVEEADRTARSVLSGAGDLSSEAKLLSTQVSNFLRQVRGQP
jgi:methyl-accepting chemotaxis protein